MYINTISQKTVLILVLVEDGLGDCIVGLMKCGRRSVLILVLVEDGLGEGSKMGATLFGSLVLILVLVEDGLGDRRATLRTPSAPS